MKTWFRISGRLYEGEGPTVFWFALLGLLLQAGIGIGYVASDSMFLSYLGVDVLPYVYAVLPFCMLIVSPLVSVLTTRFGTLTMQLLTCLLLSGFGVVLFSANQVALAEGPEMHWIFFAIKIYSVICYITVYTIYWNFVDTYFDIMRAKRLFPLLGGANAFGSMLGGYLVTVCMQQSIPVGYLFLVWGGTALLSVYPTIHLNRFPRVVVPDEQDDHSLGEQMTALKRGFFRSRYTLLLAASSFLVMILAPLCEYHYMHIFEQMYESEEQLADLLGLLFMSANIFNTFVILVLFNWMVTLFGVRNIALIQPMVYLMTFIGFIAVADSPDALFWMAVAGFFAFQGIHTSVEYTNFNLIITPIARDVKASIRTLIEGWAEPFGAATAGVVLLFATVYLDLSLLGVTVFAAALGVVYLITLLMLRADYAPALMTTLRNEWLDFSENEPDIIHRLGPDDIQSLQARAETGPPRERLSACRLLWAHDSSMAIRNLLEIWNRESDGIRKECGRILNTMLAAGNTDINRQLLDWLVHQDEPTRQALVQLLRQHSLVSAHTMLDMLESDRADIRAAGSGLLWHHWDIRYSLRALQTLSELLQGPTPDRRAAVESFSSLKEGRYAQCLQMFQADPDGEIQRHAGLSLARLVSPERRDLIPTLIEGLDSADAEVQQSVFDAIQRIGDSNAIPALLQRAPYFSPPQRRLAYQTIIHIGLKSVPVCVQVIQDERYPFSGRAIAARALAHLAMPQLEALLHTLLRRETTHAYRLLYTASQQNSTGQHSAAYRCLQWLYRDEQQASIRFILELLSLGGQIANHEMLAASLASQDTVTRSHALETLEQAVPRTFYRELLPLIDGRPEDDILQGYRQREPLPFTTFDEMLEMAWKSTIPLEQAIAAQALVETEADAQSVLERLGHALPTAQGLVQQVILSLLARRTQPQDTLIDRLALFKGNPFFSALTLNELVSLAMAAEPRSLAEGEYLYEQGAPASHLYLVAEGVCTTTDEPPLRTGAGELAGTDVLNREARYRETRYATGPTVVYALSTVKLNLATTVYPSLAIQWIRTRAH